MSRRQKTKKQSIHPETTLVLWCDLNHDPIRICDLWVTDFGPESNEGVITPGEFNPTSTLRVRIEEPDHKRPATILDSPRGEMLRYECANCGVRMIPCKFLLDDMRPKYGRHLEVKASDIAVELLRRHAEAAVTPDGI